MKSESIRVLLADDHALVRAGFRRLLEGANGIEVVGEVEDGRECVRQARLLEPDVVVLDLAMPEMDGFQALSQILAHRPEARVLILSHHEEPAFAERALEQGAAGYLGKGAAPDLLYSAVREVASGRRYLDPAIAQALVLGGGGGDGPLKRLSERELAVFLGLAEGCSMAELAEQMHISQNTVTTHYARIKRKLGVSSRTELTRLAIRHGLMEP